MYNPAHFAESRPNELHEFMRRHPFASIVAPVAGRLDANHVPLLLDAAHGPCGRLRGHIARANSMWRDIEAGTEVLVVFHGPNAYISPNFYPSKQTHGMVVPTWNYGVVHARGRIAWLQDPQWLRALVTELTERHEAGQPAPWRVADAPEEYLEKMLKGIVGLEIAIEELQGKMKFSQNRDDADRAGVRRGLSAWGSAGASELAGLMSAKDSVDGGGDK